jgi:hypothetical protein
MPSTALRRWYINIANRILNIIHRPLFYLKQDVPKTEICFHFQEEPTELDQINRPSLCLRTLATTSLIFIKQTRQKPTKGANIFSKLNKMFVSMTKNYMKLEEGQMPKRRVCTLIHVIQGEMFIIVTTKESNGN